MQQKLAPTLILWIILAQIFMGIVAYEWLPVTYRGSWILLLLLVMSGVFLNIGMALILGLVAFLSMTVYFSFDLTNQSYIERQLLLLFVIPIAPIFLSAIRHNIQNALRTYRAIQSYDRNYQYDIFRLTALNHFQVELRKLLKLTHKDHYTVYTTHINNALLIREMLGEDVWKKTQNQIMTILCSDHDNVIYHFINEQLSEIKSIVIHENKPADDQTPPQFIQELQALSVLKLKIEHHMETFHPTVGVT